MSIEARVADKILTVGKAVGTALYRSTYDGQRNIPCLSVDQQYVAGLAAVEAIEEWERQQRMKQGD